MANLRDIKRRIASVKSTQKITKAMKMVAASKLRRAQAAIQQARPYALHMRGMVDRLTARREFDGDPLLRAGAGDTIALVVVTSDRGLCGGFNTNTVARAIAAIANDFPGKTVELVVIGRKGLETLKRRAVTIRLNYTGLLDQPRPLARSVVRDLVEDYSRGQTAAVYCVYNEFVSAVQQRLTLERLLPLEPGPAPEGEAAARPIDFLYEPSRESILESLLQRNLETQMHRILLETTASELGARMTAMDGATRNAGDVIDQLTLQYNRARQNAITTELIEVISGAEAL